jgi:hypothetical protein
MVPLFFVAALLPGLYWDKGPETAPVLQKAGIERVFVPAARLEAWPKQGIRVEAADPAKRTKLTTPGVQYRMNQAAATSMPWLDANGWQIVRQPGGSYYYDVPAAAVPLALAEAYAYQANAIIHPAGDPESFGSMLAFLKRIDRTPLPAMANIGIQDDGSDITGEVMNLLSRRNLLFRVETGRNPKLDLNIKPDAKEAGDPYAYAQKIRQQLGDDKRLLRLYGSEVVIGRLTGEGRTARLHLLNYSNRKVVGLRVRVRGQYAKGVLAVFGHDGAALADFEKPEGATEFTVPEMGAYAVVDLEK